MTAPAGARAAEEAKAAVVGGLVAWSFGLALPLLFVLTWAEAFSPLQQMARAYALPVLAVQLAIIVASLAEGVRLGRPQWIPLALLCALLVHAWIGAIGSALLLPSLLRTGIWTVQLAFGFAIANLWRHGMLDLGQFRTAVLTGFVLFFALLAAFVATTEQTYEERIFSLPAFGNVRWFAYYATVAVGLAAPGLLSGDRRSLVLAAVAFAAMYWTGARGGFFAAGAGLAGCAVLFAAFREWRVWLRLLLCAAAGCALGAGLAALIPFEGQGLDELAQVSDSLRVAIWKDTLEAIGQRPWLGWGEGQFRHVFRDVWPVAQPHNLVLQVLLAWGVLGGVLLLALAAWAAPRFLRATGAESAPFQCAALMLAAYSMIDGALYYAHSLALFALCCSAAIAAGMPRDGPAGGAFTRGGG
jgi:O-antigen ligase